MWHLAPLHSTLSHLSLSCMKYFESPTPTFGNCALLITHPPGPRSISTSAPLPSLPLPPSAQGLKYRCISFQFASQEKRETITPIVCVNWNWLGGLISFPPLHICHPETNVQKPERAVSLICCCRRRKLLKFFFHRFSLKRCQWKKKLKVGGDEGPYAYENDVQDSALKSSGCQKEFCLCCFFDVF